MLKPLGFVMLLADSDEGLTTRKNSIINQNPNIPTSRTLHNKRRIPQRLWRITHGKQHDDANARRQRHQARQYPQRRFLPPIWIHDAVQQGCDCEFGKREGDDAQREVNVVDEGYFDETFRG